MQGRFKYRQYYIMILLILLGFLAFVYISYKLFLLTPVFGRVPSGQRQSRIESSPNFIKGQFRNVVRVHEHMSMSKLPALIQQNKDKTIDKRPQEALDISFNALTTSNSNNASDVKFTWFGHSCILLELDAKRILIDPMLGPYASPIPGTVKRFSDTSTIDWKNIKPLDLVVLSHDHYDHLDYYTIKRIKNKVKHFVVALGVGAHLERWGVKPEQITECYWHESFEFDNISFTSCPTKHFSGRKPNSRNSTLWCSWVIKSKTKNIFFSSDSGYFHGFEDTGNKFGPFDLCFIECGQYNTLWKENHMMPEESLQAFLDVKGSLMVPIHWAGFSLAPHDWREPIERLLLSANDRSLRHKILTPQLGETMDLNNVSPTTHWWRK